MPTLSCTPDFQAVFLGLFAEFDGISVNTGAYVYLDCDAGMPFYSLRTVANGSFSGGFSNVNAEDQIKVSYEVSGSTLTVTATDITTPLVVTSSASSTGVSNLVFGAFSYTGQPNTAPDIGTVKFKKNKVNGLPIASYPQDKHCLLDSGQPLIGATALTPNSSFKLVYQPAACP